MKLIEYYKIIFLIIGLSLLSMSSIAQSSYFDYQIAGIDNAIVRRTVSTVTTTINNKPITGRYLTILGQNHSSVEKPYIIIEGIDFLDNTYFDSHIWLFNAMNINTTQSLNNALIYNLYINGYDVIIFDFDNSTIKIQDNAMLLVQLLKDIYTNNSLTEDNFVVMGYSMGGLVARYALTWMEANNQNHHTRLFISHDAPQKGANFPLGLQELVEDIRNNTSIAWVAVNALMMSFNASMPAASQMLIYHYSNSKDGIAKPSDEGVSFFSELYNLSPTTNGYPARPVKIATSNGNFNGVGQGILPGDKILDFNYTKDNGICVFSLCSCSLWSLIWGTCDCPTEYWAPDVITATVRAGFDGTQPLEKFNIYSLAKYPIGNTNVKIPMGGSGEQTFKSSNYSYDVASGSYSPTYMNELQSSISAILGVTVQAVNNTCFIPTVSALDLNLGIDQSFDLNSSQCYTNFDYIYANNSANTTANNNHFSLQPGAEAFIMNHVLSNETPRSKYFYSDIDLTIPANINVNSNEQYNKSAQNTITNAGSFIINSGGSSTLVASQSIELKPGFSVETGGSFSAIINPADLMCNTPVLFIPRQLAPGLQPEEGTSIQKTYDCSNYTEMPDYDPNKIYFNCGVDSTQYNNTESVDSILNANITIFPNPTSGIMDIIFTEEIPIDKVVVKVYDYMGNLIYTVNPVESYNLQFNLPNCLPGLLTVQFSFNNSTYIFSKKVLKQ